MSSYKVYVHRFPNGKIYIGITRQNPETRWQKGNGYRRNQYMYKAIKKYGWENIEHEILADFLTEQEACEMEVLLIKKYNSNKREYGYNITEGGTSPKLEEATKEKISKSRMGLKTAEEVKKKESLARKKFLEENPTYYKDNPEYYMKGVRASAEKNSKKVEQYDIYGNLIATWKSAREAERALGICRTTIMRCCNHLPKYKTAGGYRWEYANK